MCEEILLQRYDDTPWGFRLTGGHDFGIPLTVIRVSGGSLAEEAGMCVGDMIIEINGDSTAHITHSEAQQCILEAGNIITLTVTRGSPVVAVTPTRGLLTPSATERPTSSVGSVSEYELHTETKRAVSRGSGHDMTEEEIAEKLLESAEVIENNGKNVIGVNFKRFVPKCDFIKNSLVFQTLQEELLFDQKSEQEQLKKSPTKRFSTFMTTPNRPRIKPPEKKKLEEPKKEEVIESENQKVEECIKSESCEQACTRTVCALKDIEDYVKPTETEVATEGGDVEHDEEVKSENLIEFENSEEEPKSTDQEETENASTNEELIEYTEEVTEPQTEEKKEPENKFEKSLLDIQNQLTAIRELPLQIQNHISLLEKQLSALLSSEAKSTETTEPSETHETNIDIEEEHKGESVDQESIKDELEDTNNDDVFETGTTEGTIEDVQESGSNKVIEEDYDEDAENKESIGRPMYPLTPLPRPIVLPGGRKWRGPKDAYNEKFIAETLISQAEVLVGSTLGVNFRKYEAPKFDVSNSAVYKLVHNIEAKATGGIENRPPTVHAADDFYQHKPINERQRYLASLPQPEVIPDLENQSGY